MIHAEAATSMEGNEKEPESSLLELPPPKTMSYVWFPTKFEDEEGKNRHVGEEENCDLEEAATTSSQKLSAPIERTLKRRLFLFMTTPESSLGSMIFFWIVLVGIVMMNAIMVMESMKAFQFTPTDCYSCGGSKRYAYDVADVVVVPTDVVCVCPPAPKEWTISALWYLVLFFSVEWILRVALFTPPPKEKATTFYGAFQKWLSFVFETTQVLDFLATFPYYLEHYVSMGFMPLRLLRLFRIFRLIRLGQYNSTFESLVSVMIKSTSYIKFLLTVLCFGAVFFGSMVYTLERGEWTYIEKLDEFAFVRQGETLPSPFISIPSSFWWYVVTATTVGYGEIYPVTTAGRYVAVIAMLTGILAVAFPVSIFTELWSAEIRSRRANDTMHREHEKEMNLGEVDRTITDNTIEEESIDLEGSRQDASRTIDSRLSSSMNGSSRRSNSMNGSSRSLAIGGESEFFVRDCIVVPKEHWIEMVTEYGNMKESQDRLRALLKRYSPKSEELFRS